VSPPHPANPIRTIDHWDNYNALARLAGELEALGATGVATIDEPCIRAAAFLRDQLGLPGQNHQSAVASTDKSVMKKRLAALQEVDPRVLTYPRRRSGVGGHTRIRDCEIFRDRSGRWLVGEFASRPGGLLSPRMLQLNTD
jgi:hypothetical protein